MTKNKIYLVVFDWATEDDHSVETNAFDSYEKAVNYYNDLIEYEKQPDMWAASAFKDNGELEKDYELDELKPDLEKETECYWDLTCKDNYCLYDYLSIRILEVK